MYTTLYNFKLQHAIYKTIKNDILKVLCKNKSNLNLAIICFNRLQILDVEGWHRGSNLLSPWFFRPNLSRSSCFLPSIFHLLDSFFYPWYPNLQHRKCFTPRLISHIPDCISLVSPNKSRQKTTLNIVEDAKFATWNFCELEGPGIFATCNCCNWKIYTFRGSCQLFLLEECLSICKVVMVLGLVNWKLIYSFKTKTN